LKADIDLSSVYVKSRYKIPGRQSPKNINAAEPQPVKKKKIRELKHL